MIPSKPPAAGRVEVADDLHLRNIYKVYARAVIFISRHRQNFCTGRKKCLLDLLNCENWMLIFIFNNSPNSKKQNI
jgi:hypothetical protein